MADMLLRDDQIQPQLLGALLITAANFLHLWLCCAGTAKTTTLKLLMYAHPNLKPLCTAFNKAVVEDAKGSCPSNVDCK